MKGFRSAAGMSIGADELIAEFKGFEENVLEQMTNTDNAPRTVNELRALRTHVKRYNDMATTILDDPAKVARLSAEQRHDVELIRDETTQGLLDIDVEADPDSKWSRMSQSDKHTATERVRVDDTQLRLIRARLRGDKHDEIPPTKKIGE